MLIRALLFFCSFTIYASETHGKTTLLRIVLGLLSPNFGSVTYDLKAIGKRPGTARIRYAPQHGGLWMKCSVMENTLYFGLLYGYSVDDLICLGIEYTRFLGVWPPNKGVEEIGDPKRRVLNFLIANLDAAHIVIMDDVIENTDVFVK